MAISIVNDFIEYILGMLNIIVLNALIVILITSDLTFVEITTYIKYIFCFEGKKNRGIKGVIYTFYKKV